jgi:hypothetical protein
MSALVVVRYIVSQMETTTHVVSVITNQAK